MNLQKMNERLEEKVLEQLKEYYGSARELFQKHTDEHMWAYKDDNCDRWLKNRFPSSKIMKYLKRKSTYNITDESYIHDKIEEYLEKILEKKLQKYIIKEKETRDLYINKLNNTLLVYKQLIEKKISNLSTEGVSEHVITSLQNESALEYEKTKQCVEDMINKRCESDIFRMKNSYNSFFDVLLDHLNEYMSVQYDAHSDTYSLISTRASK